MGKTEPENKDIETIEATFANRTHGFPQNVVAELNKSLDASKVSTRQQAGQNLSYIEAWWAISEANRIFGNGGWNREVMESREIQNEHKKSSSGKELWYVGYTGRVRITVLGALQATYRDGCGFGQGIDADLGKAHESAWKEMEADAMKRALMTFGYPLGLAIYDKSRAHIQTPPSSADVKAQYEEALKVIEPTSTWLKAFKEAHPSPAFGHLIIEAWTQGCVNTDQVDAYVNDGVTP